MTSCRLALISLPAVRPEGSDLFKDDMANLDNMGNLANPDTNIGRVSVWTESEMGSEPILAVLQCQANSRRGRSKLLDPIPLQKSV
jgi:hypothetical protein